MAAFFSPFLSLLKEMGPPEAEGQESDLSKTPAPDGAEPSPSAAVKIAPHPQAHYLPAKHKERCGHAAALLSYTQSDSYTPSFSSAARRRQMQNTAMACSSSATGGRDGAMRMLLSLGSLP